MTTSDEQLAADISRLATETNSVVLAHNYQPMEIQDCAGYTGDSLGLSRQAAETDADTIVFCGVKFMAETAKILSPGKRVVTPEPVGLCPMAKMIDADGVARMRAEHPGGQVVCYVNSTAEVKAASDACCTSANALEVVDAMESGTVLFVPDRNLASWVARSSSKRIVPWDGFCHVHRKILTGNLKAAREAHPDAVIIVHPECDPEVVDMADEVLSTSGMRRYAAEADEKKFVVGTEATFLERLARDNPGKQFYFPGPAAFCPNMKQYTLAAVLECLEGGGYEIDVPEDVRAGARVAIDRMMAATGGS